MKKLMMLVGAAVMTAFTCLSVYAMPNGVVTTTANIGGNSGQLVYIDMSSPNRRAEAVIANQVSPEKPSDMLKEVKDGNVVAAMNGGFFAAYTKGTIKFPDNYFEIYGTVISQGKVVNNGNISAPGLVFDVNGKPYIGYVDVSTYCSVNGGNRWCR